MRAHDGDPFDDELGPAQPEPQTHVITPDAVDALTEKITNHLVELMLKHGRILEFGAAVFQQRELEDLPW